MKRMDKRLVSTATIVGPVKAPGPQDWREKYRSAVEAQCAREIMLKCPACGWIHMASSDPDAAGKTECFSCRGSYEAFVRASVNDVLQVVGAAMHVIAVPPHLLDIYPDNRMEGGP